MYTSMYYILTYFSGSFGRYNMHAKIFCWLMTVYPIFTALAGFQFTNLLPYILQVVSTITGYYTAHLLNCKPELTSYSKTHQSPKDNSLNGHQIAANLAPPKIQTYAEVVACLKEVKTKPTVNSSNDYQQLPVFRPEGVVQLNYSGDVVNSGGRTKHHHFYSPEQTQPGSAALKTLSQDPCPASVLSAKLNPAKIEEAKTHGIKAPAVW
ncbi:hypothetical protein DSO57_1031914 [Entomophthora muscae]|uniref:Uncharacterized protein n=1 Tax=Entomophthora muscae TaxID=34485 RepID=A0ACC2RRG3_9FUNG|nr:hypothetical protein DSO57_1031914 [Entomophthora muscae]